MLNQLKRRDISIEFSLWVHIIKNNKYWTGHLPQVHTVHGYIARFSVVVEFLKDGMIKMRNSMILVDCKEVPITLKH